MKQLKNFQEANDVLAGFVPNIREPGSYTLDRMQALMNYIGNPQNSLRIIHVAGTSGKTSTSYYAAALLQAAGKKVGLTVSPHVDEVNERVQINLIPLAEAEFCAELSEFLNRIEPSRLTPSYFECLIAFAYWEFARQGVDYAVIEVGLGGLLDGTNVINNPNKVCVITDIGLDHIDRLGSTITDIAAQKAGIIQKGTVAFCHRQDQEILDVFQERCHEQHAELHIVENEALPLDADFLPLFQRRNFSLAQAAIAYVSKRDTVAAIDRKQLLGVIHTLVPGRMEILNSHGKTIILDGAHNAQKLHALFGSIQAKYPNKPIAALISFADGRSYRLESSLDELHTSVTAVIVTAFHAGQDLPHGPVAPRVLLEGLQQRGLTDIVEITNPLASFQALLSRPEPVLLVTGSFFLINDVRREALKLERS